MIHQRAASRRYRRGRGEDGVALVEFAIVAPLLFLLIFGIIDFGWAFFQSLDVRHAAREGGRLAAVDYHSTLGSEDSVQLAEIVAATCTRMDDPGSASVGFHRPATSDVGEELEITVELEFETLTGMFDSFLPDTLTSEVSTRIEQEAHWANMAAGAVTACSP